MFLKINFFLNLSSGNKSIAAKYTLLYDFFFVKIKISNKT